MLKYEIKLGDNSIKRDKLVWKEKYLSSDLSYITGVTEPSYHLEKFERLASTNSINNTDSTLNVECKNVKRQGYIIVKEKEYDVFTSSTIDYSIINSGETIGYQYIVNKDKFFYWGKFPNEDKYGYIINNLLNYDEASSAIVETIKVESGKTENPIKIDTVYWIEDGEVEIDGNVYVYDVNEGNKGILKYKETGDALPPSAITRCKDIEFNPCSSSTMYEEVTKFKLTKNDRQEEGFDRITFARYFYYVKYKDHYCNVKQKYSGDSYEFVCEIPLYVISAKTEDRIDNLATKDYPLYFADEFSDETSRIDYENYHNDNFLINSSSGNILSHRVYNMNDLKNVIAFIYIGEEKTYFTVEHDVINANDGNEIIVYLDNIHSPLQLGEQIMLENDLDEKQESIVYNANSYGGEDEEYVIFNSRKYLVQKNLLDKVIINGNEYNIDYINGKTVDENCLVTIGEEKVPMLILSASTSGGTLQRYGKIVVKDSNSAVTANYNIRPYDGVIIDNKKYIVREVSAKTEPEDEEVVYKYASIDIPRKYTFNIIEKIGNSTYICEPDVNITEFTDEFNRMITNEICNDVVSNQNSYTLYVENKIFGDKSITNNLPFLRNNTPTSSDDYYDLFNDLTIFVKNGYIDIPLPLKMDVANNTIQDDIVTRDFFEAEKEKAINPIVDMEKDVYMPKYMNGAYSGVSTTFEPIYKINLNFHFRTRNLDSWKINDGDVTYDTSATTDNWFITDFHPYCDILSKKRDASGQTLMEASDLMGLLNFTNDDIFYQRSKVAKSFARLSFYDSTDPQTQSLLATSCIFVDEHKLFKRYIDNSRKYEREYGSVSKPIFRKNESGFIIEPRKDVTSKENIYKTNKINVRTEYLGLTRKRISYNNYEGDGVNVNMSTDEHRISSRLVVDNKYVTDTSSEGFYIYIFREYAEKLHPKPIYMKIEFNHAGIGKTIPFIIPMHWSGNTTDSGGTAYNKMYPERSLNLRSKEDEDELKKGIPLSYVYAQTYIPLYAVYDFEKKEYGYVFDSRYVKQDENGVLNLNLFEMKIMNESQNPTEEELVNIRRNQQIRAIINVNERQFNKNSFNYEVE